MPLPTAAEMAAQLEAEQAAADRRRAAAVRRIRAIVGRAEARGLSYLDPTEDAEVNRLLGERDRAVRAAEDLAPQIEQFRSAAAEDRAWLARASERHPVDLGPAHRAARGRQLASLQVGRNERTYRPDTDPRGTGFLRDVGLAHLYGPASQAGQRLARHMTEEEAERSGLLERASTSGQFPGLVVPQYLTDMYAPVARAMRPFADVCNPHDLPAEGMSVNIPSLSTPSQAALQGTENTAVATASPADSLVTENVQTAAGSATISRQAIDRGTGVDQVIMQDLFNAVATNLDSTLINQATTGLSALSTAIAPTAAVAAVTDLWPYLFQAGSRVERAYLQVAQWSHLVMGISRWNWLTAALSSQFPFAGSAVTTTPPTPPPDAHQGALAITSEYGPAVRGRLSNGKLVCVDANVPATGGAGSNQDEIYAVPASECHLWEAPDAPVMIRAEQPAAASLGILFVAFEYFAYSFRRVNGAVPFKISGTNLTVPTGY